MNGQSTSNWITLATRAAFTLLLIALVTYVVWKLLLPLLPALLIAVALIGILRLAVGRFRRGGW